MNKNILLIIIILVNSVLFNGCSFIAGLGGHTDDADYAYNEERYDEAYELYNEYIETRTSRNRDVEPGIYEKAGISAYKVDKTNKAIEFLRLASRESILSADGFVTLAKSYREIDNLTLEIRNLEAYVKNYPNEPGFEKMQKRYFETLVEGRNWQEAYDLWQELPEDTYKDEALLEKYLNVTNSLDKNDKATDIAKNLLAIKKNNKVALDWLARKYYYQAVERYNSEMQAYEQNRTHRQYALLREAWPVIHQDYRTSRDYFLRLYDIDANSEYARFLANIYERLNDDVNARYYRQRAD